MKSLIITNGDAAAESIRQARINGEILAWRDILHEGPVPQVDTLEELSEIRVAFLAGGGWGDPVEIAESFAVRDSVMRGLSQFSDVTLWFEHDLYDQLQLLQILDYLGSRPELHSRVSLIQAGSFISKETPSRLKMHLKLRKPIEALQYGLGQGAWRAFRAASPENWTAFLRYDTSPLPFLRHSILRHMEEFPSPRTGLTRTEAFILEMIYTGHATPISIFHLFEENEEAAFMGDWSFWRILDSLAEGAAPFITGFQVRGFSPFMDDEMRGIYLNSELKLTGLGMTALHGKKDALDFRRLDRWMGGTHLTNKRAWRWDAASRMLLAPA
jgi:hypothetical protein